jgi:hypothetical protein
MTDLISLIELTETCNRSVRKAKLLGLPMLSYLLAMATEEARQNLAELQNHLEEEAACGLDEARPARALASN